MVYALDWIGWEQKWSTKLYFEFYRKIVIETTHNTRTHGHSLRFSIDFSNAWPRSRIISNFRLGIKFLYFYWNFQQIQYTPQFSEFKLKTMLLTMLFQLSNCFRSDLYFFSAILFRICVFVCLSLFDTEKYYSVHYHLNWFYCYSITMLW